MSAAEDSRPVSANETQALFADLASLPVLILAVSGGPDSTALLVLAARWRAGLRDGPNLIAVTVDHGLRPEAAREAADVARLARKLGVTHRILRWIDRKPKTGLQAAARAARYNLLAEAARAAGARHILAAHTRDDQAETVLLRLARASGIAGLSAMTKISPLPATGEKEISLVRPLLDLPKSRLIATLKAARVRYAVDLSNRDPRFTRVRLRSLMPALEREGLTAARLALLARRFRRANAAIEHAADAAFTDLLRTRAPGPLVFDAEGFRRLPEEIALRVLGRAVALRGDEGPVELGKLESLQTGLAQQPSPPPSPFRRTLAGALVTLADDRLIIDRAPPRRPQTQRLRALTKRKGGKRKVTRRR